MSDHREIELWHEIGQKLSFQARRLGLTQEALAEKSGYDVKTVHNAFSGKGVKRTTLQDIASALGIGEICQSFDRVEISDESHGQYTKGALSKYVGSYAVYRRSFVNNNLIRGHIKVFWSTERRCAMFYEHQKYADKNKTFVETSFQGDIYLGDNSTLLHLLSVTDGSVRMTTLTRIDPPMFVMKGAMLTQTRRPLYAQPAVYAVYLTRLSEAVPEDNVRSWVCEIEEEHEDYEEVDRELKEAEHEIVLSNLRTESLGERVGAHKLVAVRGM